MRRVLRRAVCAFHADTPECRGGRRGNHKNTPVDILGTRRRRRAAYVGHVVLQGVCRLSSCRRCSVLLVCIVNDFTLSWELIPFSLHLHMRWFLCSSLFIPLCFSITLSRLFSSFVALFKTAFPMPASKGEQQRLIYDLATRLRKVKCP